ncbi:putative bifunctional diguanylate cyclase/phosphodiesterase [Allohahella marinimesophila]|uniref:PAS domain S-box-containing protein/diguanylate cyclase (GGDEF)-like protein n=1 Tax=Allohahella marinimesophila TaxID=1054972 RepID=A0ABP7P1H3_9GAMM
MKHIYDSATDFAIFTVDVDGIVSSWNSGAETIFGFSELEMIGADSCVIFTPEDRANGELAFEMNTAAATGRAADYRWHLRKNGERFWADGVLTPIRDDVNEVIGYLKILRDITDKKLAQEELKRLSATDALSGLYNRASFDVRTQEMISLCERGGHTLHLLLIDLDRFKEVNDTLGHQAGDELLLEVASRLKNASRESDFIARLGGDEFGILQLGIRDPSLGGSLAAKIVHALAQPFGIGETVVEISASIGIASSPDDSAEASGLMRKADIALYKAKSAGRNGYQHFTDELDRIAHKRNQDSNALRAAVAAKQLSLVYQPIISCYTGQATAMEALVRFPGRHLSDYSVDYMIDLAQELGLIFDIGVWVFAEASKQLMRWKSLGISDLKICINTCAKELLHNQYLTSISDALVVSGIEAGDIDIELTERDAIDLEGNGVLEALVTAGFRLSLDDFGVGFSSLSYLRTLPVTTLKLDKSFLDGVPLQVSANAVAKSVITLAKELNLLVIAEGVEDKVQAQFLNALRCDAFQGFLFSPGMPESLATEWLMANRNSHPSHEAVSPAQ